jgi:hypothetical protein
MIEKKTVEDFLRANGIPPTAPDEEIRSVLLSARWDNNDVNTALLVLKENNIDKSTHVDSLHKVFHTDGHLSPSDINSLLGISVRMEEALITAPLAKPTANISFVRGLAAILLAVLIAVCGVGYVMYSEQSGFFHPSYHASQVGT